jgi:NAD(P)-dependent dehydrogenase (short-subunit alcohol dehydrogenase family)
MTDDTILPFSFPAVHAKKVTAAFDGGRLTSNGGVMLLAMAERRLGLADKLARVFPDRREQVTAAIEETTAEAGRLDFLFNNAGSAPTCLAVLSRQGQARPISGSSSDHSRPSLTR